MTWTDAWDCSNLKTPYCCLAWSPDFVNDEYGPRIVKIFPQLIVKEHMANIFHKAPYGTGLVCYEMTSTLDAFRSFM